MTRFRSRLPHRRGPSAPPLHAVSLPIERGPCSTTTTVPPPEAGGGTVWSRNRAHGSAATAPGLAAAAGVGVRRDLVLGVGSDGRRVLTDEVGPARCGRVVVPGLLVELVGPAIADPRRPRRCSRRRSRTRGPGCTRGSSRRCLRNARCSRPPTEPLPPWLAAAAAACSARSWLAAARNWFWRTASM